MTSHTEAVEHIRYEQYYWGEIITGTKDQLQSFGLGAGMPYPGGSGGPKRAMTVVDPRGFKTKISRRHDGLFDARIEYPGVPPPRWEEQVEAFPGVRKREWTRSDEYVGRAEALIAAGLVRADQLPGQPGMRKICVRILPDGTAVDGPPNGNTPEAAHQEGALEIMRTSKMTYQVRIFLSQAESARREVAHEVAEDKRQWKIQSMPRPRTLQAGTIKAAAPRGHLRLVWSAPSANL